MKNMCNADSSLLAHIMNGESLSEYGTRKDTPENLEQFLAEKPRSSATQGAAFQDKDEYSELTPSKWGTRDNFRTLCGYPLTPAASVISVLLVFKGICDIYVNVSAYKNIGDWDSCSIIGLLVACAEILVGMGGCALWWVTTLTLVKLVDQSFQAILVNCVFSLIMQLLTWIMQLTGTNQAERWVPSPLDIFDMVLFLTLDVILLGSAWWVLGCFKSLTAVLALGGTGWEKKNFEDLGGKRLIKINKHVSMFEEALGSMEHKMSKEGSSEASSSRTEQKKQTTQKPEDETIAETGIPISEAVSKFELP